MKTNSKLFAFAVMAFMLVGAFAIVADQGGSDADVGDTFDVGDYTYTIVSVGETNTVSIAPKTGVDIATLVDESGALDLSAFTTAENGSTVYTVTGITDYAFKDGTALKSITFPSTCKAIGNQAFMGSGLTVLDLTGIEKIGEYAFVQTKLATVTVPSSVTSLGKTTFANNTTLGSIVWNTSAKVPVSMCYNDENLTSFTIGESYTVGLSETAFFNTGLTGFDFTRVSSIDFKCFQASKLKSINIPDIPLTGVATFSNCEDLESATIAYSNIPDSTFYGDTKLKTVTLTGTNVSIGKQAFCLDAALTSMDFSNVSSIDDRAFSGAGLTSITLTNQTFPDGSTSQFSSNPVTEVDFGSITSIPVSFLYGTPIASITIPDSVTSIGQTAFHGTNLTSVTIGEHVQTIGAGAFRDTQIRSIEFGGSETEIINLNAFPMSEYVYANGAILDDWSPALTATPEAGTYNATFKQQADSWATEPSIESEFTYGVAIEYTEGTATSGNAVTYTYVGRDGTVYAESATAPTDAGTYALHAVTAESDEYKSLSSYYNFTIVPATNTWTTRFAMEKTSFTYPEKVTYTSGVAAYGDVHYVITEANNGAVDGWPTEVGTYSVYAVVDETVNYTGLSTEENPIQFTIALPSGEDVATIDGTTYSTIAAAQEDGLTEFIVAADMRLVEDVVLASGQSIIFVTGATFTGSIEYITDAEPSVTSVLRAINLVAGSPIAIVPGSIELSGTMSADYLVLSGDVVVTANTTISAGTMLVFANDCVLTNQNEATLTIEAGAYYYNEGATLPVDTWFVNNGTAVAADYIGDNEVAVAKNSAGQVYLTLEIQDGYVGDVTGAGFVRVSWTVTDSEDAAIEYTGEVSYPNDAETFGVLVGNLTPGDYTISMYMYYTYGYSQVVRSISVDKPFTVLPQDVIIGAYYSYSAYHAVLYNVDGDNLDAGDIYVDAFTAQTGELTDGTEFQYIAITSQLTAAVDGTSAGGAYDLTGTVDIDNMVALQPWYQIAGSSAKLYAFETVAYSTEPVDISGVEAYSDLAAVVSIAVEGEVTGGVWVYAVEALDGATLTAVVDSENTYTAEVTIGAGEFKFFEFATDFVDGTDAPADISTEDIAYFLITALTGDGTTVTDAHLSLVVLDYQ